MKTFLGITAVAVLLAVIAGDIYYEHPLSKLLNTGVTSVTTKIDEDVSLVTLDEYVLVIQRGSPPRLTRVNPPVMRPITMHVPADPKQPDAPRAASIQKWTLPYSCADVRYYNAHFTKGQLEAMRIAAGMAQPTQDQLAQVRACIAGRTK